MEKVQSEEIVETEKEIKEVETEKEIKGVETEKETKEVETKEMVLLDAKEPKKIDKRCISCRIELTDATAKQHYFDHHKVYYAFIYEKEKILESLQDPAFLDLAATYAKCGKCKAESACQYCIPFFEAKNQTYL